MENVKIYILQSGINHYFQEISDEDKVVTTNSSLMAMIIPNIYTANSFRNLLKKHYKKEFIIVPISNN